MLWPAFVPFENIPPSENSSLLYTCGQSPGGFYYQLHALKMAPLSEDHRLHSRSSLLQTLSGTKSTAAFLGFTSTSILLPHVSTDLSLQDKFESAT